MPSHPALQSIGKLCNSFGRIARIEDQTMLRTGDEYLASLRDGRRVYYGGERVADVTAHPAFRNTARSFARIYGRKPGAQTLAAMCFVDGGDRFTSWCLFRNDSKDV